MKWGFLFWFVRFTGDGDKVPVRIKGQTTRHPNSILPMSLLRFFKGHGGTSPTPLGATYIYS